jgi:5-methylcytosine-specific restriction protein A
VGRLQQLPSRIASLPGRVKALPKVAERFYLSPEWRALLARLKRERGNWCAVCGAGGKGVRIIGDHIIERKDGGAELDPANVRLLCLPCHNRKTAAEKAKRAGGGR